MFFQRPDDVRKHSKLRYGIELCQKDSAAFQPKKNPILVVSKYISRHDSCCLVHRRPKPSLIGFTADLAPYLIHLRSLLNFMNLFGFYDVGHDVLKRLCFQESKI